jgi:hypothetical protein
VGKDYILLNSPWLDNRPQELTMAGKTILIAEKDPRFMKLLRLTLTRSFGKEINLLEATTSVLSAVD